MAAIGESEKETEINERGRGRKTEKEMGRERNIDRDKMIEGEKERIK